MSGFENTTFIAQSVDELVQQGVRHIYEHGEPIEARAGRALQAYGTTYVLEDPTARVHTLRAPESVTYLARELHAYFRGSLSVKDGLLQAAPFWGTICNEEGEISSNYGHYVFRQQVEGDDTQLDWVRSRFVRNKDTRQALININNITHKRQGNLDFPCTQGMQFFIRDNKMNCDVATRSADVITGLPYDMGFFSLVNELVAGVVSYDLGEEITPGYTAMITSFTQIYDRTRAKADRVLAESVDEQEQHMPAITRPLETLKDIVNIETQAPRTEMVQWVCEKADVAF
jgi:thymidylate synthase